MRNRLSHPAWSVLLVPVVGMTLIGCGNTSNPSTTTTPTADSVPVSLTMTDDPPAGVDVLFFQVSLTAATLTPASGSTATSPVSLLSNNAPIQIDVTQLQALSAFLSTANVAAGTYDSLSLTFASPQLVIFNQSDTAMASTCAVGTVCQLTPTLDNSATVSFSSAPFPLTVSSSTPLGLLVDFHLNTVIQSDLSVNLGATNGITVGQLPAAPMHPQFGSVTGEVETVTAGSTQFTMLTQWGRTFTVDTSSSTTFSGFPSSACTTAGIGCVAQGQVVQVQVTGVASGGVLDAGQVTYVQAAGTQTVEGTILGVQAPAATNTNAAWSVKMLLHRDAMASSGLPLGGIATVTIASGATWSIDNNGFTLPAGLTFTSPTNLTVGQNVQVVVEAGTLGSASTPAVSPGMWGPPPGITFTTNSVELEPSQVTATITAIDASADSFSLGFNFAFFPWVPPSAAMVTLFNVETASQTTYDGFTTDSFSGLAQNDVVSVNGWVFPPASAGGTPQLAAQNVVLHANGWF